MTGRLGREPAFRTSGSGQLIGKFPLAVHGEDGQATWHSIVVYGKLAERLQKRVDSGESLRGREFDVVGYAHTREKANPRTGEVLTDDDGQPKVERYINAVAIVNRSS